MSPDQTTLSNEYPKTIRSVCMYCKNPQKNEDKEYHIQLVEVDGGKFNVFSQNGRRGTKLVQRESFDHPVSEWTATEAYRKLVQEKKQVKNYKEIELSELTQIYVAMKSSGLDLAGVDLYMNRRGKFISLVEYASMASDATSGQDTTIRSYSTARVAKEVLKEIGMGQTVDGAEVMQGLSRVTRMLANSGLEDMDVFLGYKDTNGEVYRGVPAQYQSSDSNSRLKM